MTAKDNNDELLINQCPEFPFFGARYPDATCIDGYLWDLDSYEDGLLTKGGEEPCPFCNREEFIENVIDGEEFTREQALEYIQELRDKWNSPVEVKPASRSIPNI